MRRLLTLARSLLFGWAALLVIAYVVERPLLNWTAPIFDLSWLATVHLMFDCVTLAAAGWVTGHFSRPRSILGVLIFAGTLAFWDFGQLLALNFPWMIRLIENSFRDARYLESLATAAVTQALLFGSLIAGGSFERAAPQSIMRSNPHKEVP